MNAGNSLKLKPPDEIGSGDVHEKEKAWLSEIIAKVNDLFSGDLTDQDKLVCVNKLILGKLLESETLVKQAVSNSEGQFATSPDLNTELTNAIASWNGSGSIAVRPSVFPR